LVEERSTAIAMKFEYSCGEIMDELEDKDELEGESE
jgi:hypothetical protein